MDYRILPVDSGYKNLLSDGDVFSQSSFGDRKMENKYV